MKTFLTALALGFLFLVAQANAAGLKNAEYKCSDGAVLGLKARDSGSYLASAHAADGTPYGVAVVDFGGPDSLEGKLLAPDGTELGFASVPAKGSRNVKIQWASGGQLECQRGKTSRELLDELNRIPNGPIYIPNPRTLDLNDSHGAGGSRALENLKDAENSLRRGFPNCKKFPDLCR